MIERLAAIALLLLASQAAGAVEVDLASDTAWTLSIDGRRARAIKVPGGGWNSDLQSPRIDTMKGVSDHLIYERKIDVPQIAEGQVTKILFGAVNYGAEVYIDDKLAATHAGPQVPFNADITKFVTPGKTHILKVKAYHRRHYHRPDGKSKACSVPVGFDFPAGSKFWNRWAGNTKQACGITVSIKLAVYPPVYISDMFVTPSVSEKSLKACVWVNNSTGENVTVTLAGKLSSWNEDNWKYPAIPSATCDIPASSVQKVLIGPVKWSLGAKSYWWPNIPFREDYKARLHYLDIEMRRDGEVAHKYRRRFGFVQWGEGKYYYTVNSVRVNQYSDSTCESQMSYYDCYSTAAAFGRPDPAKKRLGCPETWKRYMRIGINMNRICCSTPTEYMMASADEVGFMLMPESPIWGNRTSVYNPDVTPKVVRALVRHCRNHPCVARYSVFNEVQDIRGNRWHKLFDAVRMEDDTRPLSFDRQGNAPNVIVAPKGARAVVMRHYRAIEAGKSSIRGMGECCWGTDEMAQFAFAAREFRMKDYAYFSPWSWINYWPNFLEGMNHARHAWKANNAPDRIDGVNGWRSPVVSFTQKSLHPFLLIDHAIRRKQPISLRGCSYRVALLPRRKIGEGALPWPGYVPEYKTGAAVGRKIEVFNGALRGERMSLRWAGRWDSPTGAAAVKGGVIGPFKVLPGFHTTKTIEFKAPKSKRPRRKLYLVLESIKDGSTVFTEDALYFNIINTGV